MDSWPERGFWAALGLPILRLIIGFWRKHRGKRDPFFDWIAHRMDLEWTNMTQEVEIKTLQARLRNMQQNAGQYSPSDDSPDSSIDYLGETLTPKRRSTDRPSPPTLTKPDDGLG
jgi:hypothetical protein